MLSLQVFHICYAQYEVSSSHICPNGTVFNEKHSICDWWYNVNCSFVKPTQLYWFVGLREQRPTAPFATQQTPVSLENNESKKQAAALQSFPPPVTIPPSIQLNAHGALPPFILRRLRQRIKST